MSWCITRWGQWNFQKEGTVRLPTLLPKQSHHGKAGSWSVELALGESRWIIQVYPRLFRSLRIAALRVLRLPRFLELFQCSKMRDVKTKEVKSAHFWMLIGSCCQPYRNLPIKIFINHPDARLCCFCSSSFFYLCGFFLQANCHKCYRSCKLRSRCTVSTAVIVWRTSKKKVHSGDVHKPVWGWRSVRCKFRLVHKKNLFFKNGIAWKLETYLCIWWSLGPIAGLGWTESGLPRHAAVAAPQLPCGRHDKEIFGDANTCKLNG